MGSTRLSRRELLAQAGSFAAMGCIAAPAEFGPPGSEAVLRRTFTYA